MEDHPADEPPPPPRPARSSWKPNDNLTKAVVVANYYKRTRRADVTASVVSNAEKDAVKLDSKTKNLRVKSGLNEMWLGLDDGARDDVFSEMRRNEPELVAVPVGPVEPAAPSPLKSRSGRGRDADVVALQEEQRIAKEAYRRAWSDRHQAAAEVPGELHPLSVAWDEEENLGFSTEGSGWPAHRPVMWQRGETVPFVDATLVSGDPPTSFCYHPGKVYEGGAFKPPGIDITFYQLGIMYAEKVGEDVLHQMMARCVWTDVLVGFDDWHRGHRSDFVLGVRYMAIKLNVRVYQQGLNQSVDRWLLLLPKGQRDTFAALARAGRELARQAYRDTHGPLKEGTLCGFMGCQELADAFDHEGFTDLGRCDRCDEHNSGILATIEKLGPAEFRRQCGQSVFRRFSDQNVSLQRPADQFALLGADHGADSDDGGSDADVADVVDVVEAFDGNLGSGKFADKVRERTVAFCGDVAAAVVEADTRTFVGVVDIESTGLDVEKDKPVQIVVVNAAEPSDVFKVYCFPGTEITSGAYETHDLAPWDLEKNGARPLPDVLTELVAWVAGRGEKHVFVGHKVLRYDAPILSRALRANGLRDVFASAAYVDTLVLAQDVLPGDLTEGRLSLQSCFKEATEVPLRDGHDAHVDCLATLKVWAWLRSLKPTSVGEILAAAVPLPPQPSVEPAADGPVAGPAPAAGSASCSCGFNFAEFQASFKFCPDCGEKRTA